MRKLDKYYNNLIDSILHMTHTNYYKEGVKLNFNGLYNSNYEDAESQLKKIN